MGVVSTRMARRKALEIRDQYGMNDAFIDLAKLTEKMGIKVAKESFDDPEVSAILLVKTHGQPKIILNQDEQASQERERFSIAHEIGHFVLHKTEGAFVERNVPFAFRNKKSSTGEDINEIEANQFAAELLMPEELVRELAENKKPTERNLVSWASTFKVSLQAMAIRLESLEII
jgi:Zn-dependent peptidase ImmA (M78 family)